MCNGTGKRHAWAWKRCRHDSFSDGQCDFCDGSGWVLDVTLEKVLTEFWRQGAERVTWWHDDAGKVGIEIVIPLLVFEGIGDDDLVAALDAYHQVMEAQDANNR